MLTAIIEMLTAILIITLIMSLVGTFIAIKNNEWDCTNITPVTFISIIGIGSFFDIIAMLIWFDVLITNVLSGIILASILDIIVIILISISICFNVYLIEKELENEKNKRIYK